MSIAAERKSSIAQSIEEGWQMPAALYTDPRFYDIELEHIFKKSWQYVGLASSLKKTGDYISTQIGLVPIVIIRNEAGDLNGFVNACRHRLHPVVTEAEGCKQILQCQYHGWTYTHEGKLRSAPESETCSGFNKDDLSLIPIRIKIFSNFIFACVSDDAVEFEDYIDNADQLFNELSMDISDWDYGGTLNYDLDANWKLFTENSLECYHCPLVHQDTFSVYVETKPTEYITHEYNNTLTHVAPIIKLPGEKSTEGLKGFRFMFIWPSILISVDDFVGVVARITPNGADKCKFTVDMFTKPGADPKLVEEWIGVYDKTFSEDKIVVSAQQAAYKSGMISQGRLMQNREASIQMFQRRTWGEISHIPQVAALDGKYDPIAQLSNLLPIVDISPNISAPKPAKNKVLSELELDISDYQMGAEGVAVLTLTDPQGEDLPEWQPGAHIDVKLPNGIIRQYSLCGDHHDRSYWRIAVLNDPQSRGGSAFIHTSLSQHQKLKVSLPRNHFNLPEAEQYKFVAGGIGITPIISMIREVEAQGKNWSLLYGGRILKSMAFIDELKNYENVHIAPQDTHGYLDFKSYFNGADAGTVVCACGPGVMLDALAAVCHIDPNLTLTVERFASEPIDQTKNTAFDVELKQSNLHVHVKKDQTILEAIRDAGVKVFSSCQNGVCGTCETTVISGIPDHRDVVLTEAEREAGKSMLICISRCKSDKLVLDL